MNRDFKGVWISKDIWLNKNLSALDKVLLAEISSLDNEKGCYASNEYFAEFCGVGVATITRSIKKLKDNNLIQASTEITKTGTSRVLKVIDTSNQNDDGGSNQNDERGLINLINKYNINNNTNDISKDISREEFSDNFIFGKSPQKNKKPNLYQKCAALINEFTDIPSISNLLFQYLDLCMEMKSIRGANQWKGMLNTLDKVQVKCHPHSYEEIIEQSINHGWKTFYPINDSFNSSGSNIDKITGMNNSVKNSYESEDQSFIEGVEY